MSDGTYNPVNRHREACTASLATIHIYILVLLISALFAQGCVPIPIPTGEDEVLFGRQVTEQQLAFIRPGVTSKSEIIEHLGEPNVFWEDERIFAYNWAMRWRVAGNVVYLFPFPPHIGTHYVLLIRFDPSDRVERFEITKPRSWLPGGSYGEHLDSYGEHLKKWLKQKTDPPAIEAPQGSEGK